ncbi:unnamed protein product, partial [Brassica napus]
TTYISVVCENPTVVVFRRYLRVLILLFPSICRSVTAWGHIFSTISSRTIYSPTVSHSSFV